MILDLRYDALLKTVRFALEQASDIPGITVQLGLEWESDCPVFSTVVLLNLALPVFVVPASAGLLWSRFSQRPHECGTTNLGKLGTVEIRCLFVGELLVKTWDSRNKVPVRG